jgi:integrase
MTKDLTVKAIENLKPGRARCEVPDGHSRGLQLIVQATGSKSWAYRYRFADRTRKLTIGPYPAIGLSAARRLAGEAAQAVARGEDPAAAKQEKRAAARQERHHDADLVENVVATYIERHSRRNCRERTAAEAERILNKEIVGRWRGRRLSDIRKADIHTALDAVADRGGVMANRTLAVFKTMCIWAIERGIIDHNPAEGIRKPAVEEARDRVLADGELAEIWAAADGLGFPYGPIVQVLILTGARLREVADLHWREIDLEARVWRLPAARAKNATEHTIPLSEPAIAILTALPRIVGAGFVFTLSGQKPVNEFGRARGRLPAGDWVLHDVRRTVASGLAGMGFAPHIVEAVLNHKGGVIRGVARVYNRFDYSGEKGQALDAWAAHVMAIVSGETAPSNVTKLRA